jgi:hypothetical protein
MVDPSFHPTFHPTFLSTSHAGEASLAGSLVGSLTILRSILAHRFHSPVKTRISFGLDRPVRHVRSILRRIKKKGGKTMAVFTIMRIYEIPADSRIEATDRMLEALEFHTEKDYHVTDLVRNKDDMSVDRHWKPVELPNSTNMVTIFKRQSAGEW